MTRELVAFSLMLLSSCALSLQLQAQTSCSSSSLNGTYFYMLSGTVATNGGLAYAELGKLVADGNGGVSGRSTTSVGGSIASYSLSGTYSVQGNCTGTVTLSVNSQFTETITFQIVDGGQSAVVAFSSSGAVVGGRAYRAVNGGASQCGNASLTGAYGYLLSGLVSRQNGTFLYSDAGQVVSNGNGGMATISVANLGAGASQVSGIGTYSVATDCSGTAQVTNQNGTANYIFAVVEGGNVLFLENDSGTAVGGTAQPQLVQLVLPQFVFGGGWYSALYFTNRNNSAVSFPVNFTSDAGTPLSVPGLGTSTQVTIAPNGSAIIEAPNLGSLSQGFVTFSLPLGVTGYGIFRQSVSGRSDQEAVVPFSGATATSSTFAWDEIGFTTSFAVVNPSAFAATVNITLRDSNGNIIGTSSIPLSANSKTENTLRSLPGFTAMVGKRGSAQFSVSTGAVAVLGLRFGTSAFTSIPAVQ